MCMQFHVQCAVRPRWPSVHGGRHAGPPPHPRQMSSETATRLTPDHGRPRWAADAAPGGSAARAVTASLYIRHTCIQVESHGSCVSVSEVRSCITINAIIARSLAVRLRGAKRSLRRTDRSV